MMTTVLTLTEGKTITGMAAAIKDLLRTQDMQVQCFEMKDGNYLIQGKADDWKWMQLMGGDRAITVKATLVGGEIVILEIGEGKWLDKVSGALVGWYLMWPVMLLTAVTTYRQVTLPKIIVKCAQKYLEETKNVEAV